MKYCLLFLILTLAACQTTDKPATCSGPIFPLNVGYWQSTPTDLQAPGELNERP
ncbi:type IV secretion system lipoprotein VirB7 (plasmid) [Rhizobium sp. CC1099]|uniref:type IV secretion system lipoprotein VirB7 n=1 Tax=Rhizobium sp. CC1099 TaxID=3039160 RepID=UPI0024B178BB|nr:type IV secretion system lipoprotein VirB7 [Rhizobium sp. CC1099]WFU92138.1 type IV secretion system lipoprotein VirB7 [Rhizobium sp. CC1099]